jgi:hypothetical protein
MKLTNKSHFILIFLASCSNPSDNNSPSSGGSELISEAESYIKSISRDPDSVQFRNMTVYYGSEYKDAPGIVVCGEFNGRNGFGGYGGYEKFAYQNSGNGRPVFFISDSMIGNGQGNFELFFQNKICINSPKIFNR